MDIMLKKFKDIKVGDTVYFYSNESDYELSDIMSGEVSNIFPRLDIHLDDKIVLDIIYDDGYNDGDYLTFEVRPDVTIDDYSYGDFILSTDKDELIKNYNLKIQEIIDDYLYKIEELKGKIVK